MEHQLLPESPLETGLWTIAIIAAIADTVTTAYGLERGLQEGNPIIHAVLTYTGTAGLVALKLLVLLAVYVVIQRLQLKHRALSLSIITVVWGGVALLNAHLMSLLP